MHYSQVGSALELGGFWGGWQSKRVALIRTRDVLFIVRRFVDACIYIMIMGPESSPPLFGAFPAVICEPLHPAHVCMEYSTRGRVFIL